MLRRIIQFNLLIMPKGKMYYQINGQNKFQTDAPLAIKVAKVAARCMKLPPLRSLGKSSILLKCKGN